MLKTYAPKSLHGFMLRDLLADLQATPQDCAKFLRVTERTVFRWLAEENAPFAALAALWHETPKGRESAALDVGNALTVERGLANAAKSVLARESARLARLVAIADTGAANDPLMDGPHGAQASPRRPVLPALTSACETGHLPCAVVSVS